MINLYNSDCMEALKGMADNQYDLAIVDPPYGIGQNFNFRFGVGDKVYDNYRPGDSYFNELARVSKNRIVWGGNYFTNSLPENRCWICWQKGNPAPNFSDFELAWTSFNEVCKSAKLDSYGFNHADKRHTNNSTNHPTQKPIALYKWLLKNYAKEGDKILDTHGGSMSIALACHDMKFDLDLYEIDKDYFEAGSKRYNNHIRQLQLF